MRRHLFLIINDGGIQNYLPNVKVDKDNYHQFFLSPEGGAWEDSEIDIYENNFDFDRFQERLRYQQLLGEPYEFLLIVFCGHGFSHNGERYIEVRPDDESYVSLSQIKDACYHIRTLFISDSCLVNVEVVTEARGINGVHWFSNDSYRMNCKEIYNEAVRQTSEYTFTAGFAVSFDEEAGEDEHGGVYSQTLLNVAQEVIMELQSNPKYSQYNYASFSWIHEITANKVAKKTKGSQHPSIDMTRSCHQLPFVVVSKD